MWGMLSQSTFIRHESYRLLALSHGAHAYLSSTGHGSFLGFFLSLAPWCNSIWVLLKTYLLSCLFLLLASKLWSAQDLGYWPLPHVGLFLKRSQSSWASHTICLVTTSACLYPLPTSALLCTCLLASSLGCLIHFSNITCLKTNSWLVFWTSTSSIVYPNIEFT